MSGIKEIEHLDEIDESEAPDSSEVTTDLGHTELIQTSETLKPTTKEAPEDIAAAFFSMNQKKLLRNLSGLSKRQLVRICYNVATNGLGSKNAPLKGDLEKNTAYVMNEMITNRVIMQLAFEMEKAEKARETLTIPDADVIMKPSLENSMTKLNSEENTNG